MPLNRYELWLDFLVAASERTSTWLVWKNADSALHGRGDVDAFCAPNEVPVIRQTFAEWAESWGVGPTFVCQHIPGGVNLVALDQDGRSLLEVGTKQWKTFRGSVLASHSDMVRSIEWDTRGFRRIRVGSETALKLVLNGVLPGGRPDWVALRNKGVVRGIEVDLAGLQNFAASLPSLPTEPTVSLARAVANGNWDRNAALRLEAFSLIRGLRHPAQAGSRVAFKLGRPACPIVAALQNDRTVEGAVESWVQQTAATHEHLT